MNWHRPDLATNNFWTPFWTLSAPFGEPWSDPGRPSCVSDAIFSMFFWKSKKKRRIVEICIQSDVFLTILTLPEVSFLTPFLAPCFRSVFSQSIWKGNQQNFNDFQFFFKFHRFLSYLRKTSKTHRKMTYFEAPWRPKRAQGCFLWNCRVLFWDLGELAWNPKVRKSVILKLNVFFIKIVDFTS